MLLNLKLTNYRKHRATTVDFTSGMQVIRGNSEAGKSTLAEACAYALFGSKALRTSLDDTVTHGEPINTLKSELILQSGGKVYTFVRGKSGAEVTLDGKVFCTGQNEVSAFAASLIGADANLAANLMFSDQGSVRGALSQGPKALSELIERLASFEVFDNILEAAQTKLALGSPSLLEERLRGAESTLAAATETLPTKPNAEEAGLKIADLNTRITQLKFDLPALTKAATEARDNLNVASDSFLKRIELEKAVVRAQEQVKQSRSDVAGHTANASKVAPDLEPLKQQVANAEDYDARSKAYRVFAALPMDDRYEGTAEQFESHVVEVTKCIRVTEAELNRLDREITAANGRRINHDKCDKCGQDVTHLAHVVETNAAVDAELGMLLPAKADTAEVLRVHRLMQVELDGYRSLMTRTQASINKMTGYATLDHDVFPPNAFWIGEVPGDAGPDTAAYRARLAEAEAEAKAIEQAKTRLELVQGQLAIAESNCEKAEKALSEHTGATADDIVALGQINDHAAREVTINEGSVILANNEMATIRHEFETATKLWSLSQARVDDAEKVIADSKKDLAALAGNNALVKKLKAIRPLVANQIWNTVLASVSVMFSQIRGEQSWVSKEKNGFCVNGQAVESLSGSTLDILGVALRVALLKTFIPHCALLVLDEPAQGCDINRTESLLGFLASNGIAQTILITHEEVSSSIADNIITL